MGIDAVIFWFVLIILVVPTGQLIERRWPSNGYAGMLHAVWIVSVTYGATIGLITDKSFAAATLGYGAMGLAVIGLGHLAVLSAEVQDRKLMKHLAEKREQAQCEKAASD